MDVDCWPTEENMTVCLQKCHILFVLDYSDFSKNAKANYKYPSPQTISMMTWKKNSRVHHTSFFLNILWVLLKCSIVAEWVFCQVGKNYDNDVANAKLIWHKQIVGRVM